MDSRRLERLLSRHGGALALYAALWTATPDDAVQEAFVRLHEANPPPRTPVAWLYAVVRNVARSQRRAESRRRRRETFAARLEAAPASDLLPLEIADALEQLPPAVRETIVAHLWGGLTFSEIAQLTNSSASAAHRRYQAGLASLRQHLEQPCSPIPATPSAL